MAAEPVRPEPVLRNGRGRNSERPTYQKKKQTKHKGKKLKQLNIQQKWEMFITIIEAHTVENYKLLLKQ